MTQDKWKSDKADAPSPWKKVVAKPTRAAAAESANRGGTRDPARAPRSETASRSAPRAERSPAPRAHDDARATRPHDDARATRAVEEPRVPRPTGELRLYGVNACLAAFAARPQDLRKVYLTELRIAALKPVLAWCVQNKLGYRVVETIDLDKLSGSKHHEGVCFEMLRRAPLELDALLGAQPAADQPALLLWLDGVGNPHNLGALLRSAAHFGAGGVIVPQASSLDLSGAAARVAEGGAEAVAIARVADEAAALATLRKAGYTIVASVPRDGVDLYASSLPKRLVLVFGAEGEGMSRTFIDTADMRLMIPGSGAVESLNIAASVAVFLGEFRRQHRVATTSP